MESLNVSSGWQPEMFIAIERPRRVPPAGVQSSRSEETCNSFAPTAMRAGPA